VVHQASISRQGENIQLQTFRESADQERMFEWSETYSVGVHGLDAQHRKMFRLAAEFHRALLAGEANALVPRILDRLVQYTNVHFAYEERLMQEAQYPNFLAHKAEHEEITQKLCKFQNDFNAGRTDLAFEVFLAMKHAVRQHILGSDRQFEPYVRKTVKATRNPQSPTLPLPAGVA
jgi:hemerythrin